MSDMSGAGTGGNEGAAGADGAAAAPAAGETPDFAALVGGLGEQFGSRFDDLGARLDRIENPAGDDDGDDGDGEPLLPVFNEEDFNERGEPTLEAQAREIQRIADERVQAALEPMQAERAQERQAAQQERWDADLDALEERFPKLQDEKVQEEVVNRAVEAARALGNPALAGNPRLVKAAYFEWAAEQAAAGEIPAGSQREVTLERGGGAGPAASASDDRGDNIVKATNGSQFRLGKAKA